MERSCLLCREKEEAVMNLESQDFISWRKPPGQLDPALPTPEFLKENHHLTLQPKEKRELSPPSH